MAQNETTSIPSNTGDEERALLDHLLEQSRLYHTSKSYFELLSFVSRLRNFAPFNAMLLHVQKPGLSYAASADDWRERFDRRPKEHACPLVILWPFGPVALVYDVQDTEGAELPQDVEAFFARGPVTAADIGRYFTLLARKCIDCQPIDAGDLKAGNIRCIAPPNDKVSGSYLMHINRNHAPPVQFATLAHELAHLFLGHLGSDKAHGIPKRQNLAHPMKEIEAESVTYLLCVRNGVESRSESYLTNYVKAHATVDSLDVFQIMRAAGRIEALLGLAKPAGRAFRRDAISPVQRQLVLPDHA